MTDMLLPLSERGAVTLALLGYQRWLPRALCGATLRLEIEDAAACLDNLRHSIEDEPEVSLCDASEATLDWQALHIAHPPLLQITRDVSIVHEPGAAEAWLLPPLSRAKAGGWQFWRSEDESALWRNALMACRLNQAAVWFEQALAESLDAMQLPAQSIVREQWTMPLSVNTLWVVDGLAHYWWFGEKNTQRQSCFDWQGRQVAVRCVTHPYRCLLDGEAKSQLWRDLIIK